MAARLQRLHHRALLLRRDPPEDGVALEHLGQLVDVLGKLPRVDRLARVGQPDPARDRARRCAGCRRRSPSARRPARGSTRASRPRRAAPSPGAGRARPRCEAGRQLLAGELRRHEPGATPGCRSPRARRPADAPGPTPSSHTISGAPEHPRAVVAVARRRSTCGPRRTGRARPESSPTARGTRRQSHPGSRCRPRRGSSRPAPRRPAPRRRPTSSSSIRSNSTIPSVSVPVLSRQTTSTRARPSTAGSSWTSTLRRASVTAASPNAMLVSRTRPSGTMPTTPATAPLTAFEQALVLELAEEQQRADDHEHPGHVLQDLVDPGDELGVRDGEPAGFGRELAGVRARRRPPSPGSDRARRRRSRPRAPGRPGASGSGPTRRSAATRRARARPTRARRRRPGPGPRSGASSRSSSTTSSTGISTDDAVAHHPRDRRAEHRELVQRALRPVLLDDPDQRVARSGRSRTGRPRVSRTRGSGRASCRGSR